MNRTIAMLVLLLVPAIAQSQTAVYVVANLASQDSLALEKHEVRNLFMGNVPDSRLIPAALTPGNTERVLFNTLVIGLTESRVQSYWAQMRFTGRRRPPREFSDVASMISYLQTTPNAMGYLASDEPVPEGLTVIYRSDRTPE